MNKIVCYMLLAIIVVACNTEPREKAAEHKMEVLLSQMDASCLLVSEFKP